MFVGCKPFDLVVLAGPVAERLAGLRFVAECTIFGLDSAAGHRQSVPGSVESVAGLQVAAGQLEEGLAGCKPFVPAFAASPAAAAGHSLPGPPPVGELAGLAGQPIVECRPSDPAPAGSLAGPEEDECKPFGRWAVGPSAGWAAGGRRLAGRTGESSAAAGQGKPVGPVQHNELDPLTVAGHSSTFGEQAAAAVEQLTGHRAGQQIPSFDTDSDTLAAAAGRPRKEQAVVAEEEPRNWTADAGQTEQDEPCRRRATLPARNTAQALLSVGREVAVAAGRIQGDPSAGQLLAVD